MQKFESDKKLRELLLSTGNKILAEAAPNDCIWGIGLSRTDPRVKDPAQWCGRNILGTALMRTRDHLRCQSSAASGILAVEQESPVPIAVAKNLGNADPDFGRELPADIGVASG